MARGGDASPWKWVRKWEGGGEKEGQGQGPTVHVPGLGVIHIHVHMTCGLKVRRGHDVCPRRYLDDDDAFNSDMDISRSWSWRGDAVVLSGPRRRGQDAPAFLDAAERTLLE